VKFPGDLGQGDTDDADVEGGHKGPQTDGEENQAPPGRRVSGVGGPGHLKKVKIINDLRKYSFPLIFGAWGNSETQFSNNR